MRYSFEQADSEAHAEFGSLELDTSDGNPRPLTLLTPLWLEDENRVERIAQRQDSIMQMQDQAMQDLRNMPKLKGEIVDLLAEVADDADRWRREADKHALPSVVMVFQQWLKAAQPGEASASPG